MQIVPIHHWHAKNRIPWIPLHFVSGPWTSIVAALDEGRSNIADAGDTILVPILISNLLHGISTNLLGFMFRLVVCLLVVVLAYMLPFLLILYTYTRYVGTTLQFEKSKKNY
jgi:hypothetical protein